MFDSLFGADLPLAVRFLIAFVIVLILIGVTFWLIRRFGTERLGSGAARGRQPRLAVIDAAAVDGRRRLVLIRRDNVEHLVMIGGPSDIVIEQNIVRAVPVATPREMPVPARGPSSELRAEPTLRAMPSEDAWEEPAPLEMPLRAPRPQPHDLTRPAKSEAAATLPSADESWRPPARESMPRVPEAMPRVLRPVEKAPRRERPTAPQPEPSGAPESRPLPPEPPSKEPAATEASGDARPSSSAADVNLAEMAQRLEAALRRPIAATAEPRLAAAKPAAPAQPELAPASTAKEPARSETQDETPAEPRPPTPVKAAKSESRRAPDPQPAKPEPKPAAPKSVFDSLEEEMASLLGRPKSKE